MNKLTTRWIRCAALTAGLLVGGGAAAQGTWNLGGGSCNPNSTTPATASCAIGNVTASMSAWSNTGSNGAFVQYALADYDPNGFGTKSATGETTTNGQHAFDNVTSYGGSVEFMLIGFTSQVTLSSVSIGYFSTDADISVYRYTGNETTGDKTKASTVASSAAVGSGTSLGSAWNLVKSSDVDNTGKQMDLSGSGYSSWWIVSTYFGSTSGTGGSKLDKGNDMFKILTFAAGCSTSNCNPPPSVTPAPEPGSLALVGLALTGIYAVRRRKLAVAALVAT